MRLVDFPQIAGRLAERLGADVTAETPAKGEPFVKVPAGRIVEAATFLRDDPALAMDYLACLSGVDFPDRKEIEVVYHLASLAHRHRLTVKAVLPREKPEIATLEKVWPAANWHERECWDLLGVVFTGHSDMRRILLPDDWEGHPLRKDYKVQEYWHGIKVETDH